MLNNPPQQWPGTGKFYPATKVDDPAAGEPDVLLGSRQRPKTELEGVNVGLRNHFKKDPMSNASF